MRTTIDAAGRLAIPKVLRDAIGLAGGGAVEVTVDGSGLLITPSGPTAAVRRVDGHLVVDGRAEFTDETLFGLTEAGRR